MILQSKGVTSHVERLGAGEQVLLLHGWGPSSVTLEKHLLPLGRSLQKNHEVTMLEFPGHGSSGMPGDQWGVEQYAEWTLSLMDQLAMRQPVIIAHSFGGRVALWLAARHPERVKVLVLTGCAGLRSKPGIQSTVRSYLFKFGRLGLDAMALVPKLKSKRQAWLDALRREFSSDDYMATPALLRGSFSRIVRQDLRPLLKDIPHQTLLVWGEEDSATPLWMGKVMKKGLQNARLLVYQGDDHWAYNNQLPRYVTACESFLEEVDAT